MSEVTATSDRPRLSGLALAGLVLGIAAPFTLVAAPFALYFSFRGLYAVNASDGRLLGRRAAIVGLLLGGITSLVATIGTLAVIIARLQTADARVECMNHLRVIGVAVNQYYDDHDQMFPRAVVALDGVPPEERASWQAALLPYLDAKPNRENPWQGLATRLDLQKPWNDSVNKEALTFYVPFYQCPGHPYFDPHQHPGVTHYVGVAGVGDDAASLPKGYPRAGFFGYERTLTLADGIAPSGNSRIKGTSYIMMVLETTQHNGDWIAGGLPTVRGVGFDPTFSTGRELRSSACWPGGVLLVPRPVGPPLIGPERPFGSLHSGGLNVLWADGSVRFVSDAFPPHTFRMQASLSDDPIALATLP
jgi:prepilin-type processing-associated H-X9-DG protein